MSAVPYRLFWQSGGVLALAALFFAIFTFGSNAAINEQIPFYGTLTNASGTPLSGTYDMVFRFYDAPTGGTLLDTSTHTAGNGNAVTVTNGEFNVMLGSGTGNALDGLDFNTATIYIGLTVDSDSEMTPRERLGAAPYAFNSDQLDGYEASQLLRYNATGSITASAAETLFSITQNGAGDIFNVFDGGTEVFTITDGGLVGVGTSTPGRTLTVDGDLEVTGALYDSTSSAGTAGYVLQSTGTGFAWVATSTLGFSGGGATTLAALSDVSAGGATNGYVLVFDGADWVAQATSTLGLAGGGGGASALNDLTDVTTAGVSLGDLLYYDGASWAPIATSSLSVEATNPYLQVSATGSMRIGLDAQRAIGVGSEYDIAIGNNVIATSSNGWLNIGIGLDVLTSLNFGSENIAMGWGSMENLTNGYDNIAIGSQTMNAATADNIIDSIAIGSDAMANTIYSYQSIGIGSGAMAAAEGANNIGIGYRAGESMGPLAQYNTAIGYMAGQTMSGERSVALGMYSMWTCDYCDRSVAAGFLSLSSVEAMNTVAIGAEAGRNYRTGSSTWEQYNGRHSVFIGDSAGWGGTDYFAYNTTAIGAQALGLLDTGGHHNTALGFRAGYNINAGRDNTLIGFRAAEDMNGGDRNIVLGYDLDLPVTGGSNQMNIGALIFGTGLNATGTDIATGNIGIGTSSPSERLTVDGSARITGALFDSTNSAGLSGSVLQSTETGFAWVATSTLGFPAAGATTLTGLSDVNTAGVSLGDLLVFDGAEWIAAATSTLGLGGGFATATVLADLTDVDTFGVSTGDLLYYDGTGWTTIATSSLGFTGGGSSDYIQVSTASGTMRAGLDAQRTIDNLSNYDIAVGNNVMPEDFEGYYNTFIGNDIYTVEGTYAFQSIGIGYKTMEFADLVEDSIAIGYEAMGSVAQSYRNIALGYRAMNSSETYESIAIGYGAMEEFVGGTFGSNIAIGKYALGSATSTAGGNNIFIGDNAGLNMWGEFNVGMGQYALSSCVDSCVDMVAIGDRAGSGITNGINSVAVGAYALNVNNRDSGNALPNTVLGAFAANAGPGVQTVDGLALVGYGSFENLLTGADHNTALGFETGHDVTTGANNILIGFRTGYSLTTGSNNIAIGYEVELPSNTADNQLTIGNLIFGTGLNATGTDIATGNVGIGTSSPSSKLTVDGSTRITGDLDLDGLLIDSVNSTGTLGYVLQRTANGMEWTVATGGGGEWWTSGSNAYWDIGNVGIGATTSPNTRLVVADDEDTALLALADTTNGRQVNFYTGTSSPENRVAAPIGSLYIDNTSGTLYQKTGDDGGTDSWGVFQATDNATTTHMVRMEATVVQNFLHNTFTTVQYDSVAFDTAGMADTDNDQIVIQRSGTYLIKGLVSLTNHDDSDVVYSALLKNGNLLQYGTRAGSITNLTNYSDISTIVELQAGDTIQLRANNFEGAAQNTVVADGSKPYLVAIELAANGDNGRFRQNASTTYLANLDQRFAIGTTTADYKATIWGDLFIGTSTTPTLLVQPASGYVGIGTSTPRSELTVEGTIQASNLLGGAVALSTDASGNIIRDPSDIKLKKNITEITGALDTVLALRGVRYQWLDEERFGSQTEIGFIAQEVDTVLPEVVRKGGEYWSLNTRNILAVVVEAIQEMWTTVRGNQEKIAALEARLAALEAEHGITPAPVSEDTSDDDPDAGTGAASLDDAAAGDATTTASTTDQSTPDATATTTASTTDAAAPDETSSSTTASTTDSGAASDAETTPEPLADETSTTTDAVANPDDAEGGGEPNQVDEPPAPPQPVAETDHASST